jgi:hypothetical protein
VGTSDLAELADLQGGVFARRQARDLGWSSGQVQRRVRRGEWRPVLGVALTAGVEEVGLFGRAWAGVLSWPRAVVSYRSAASLWGLDVDDGRLHLSVPAWHRPVAGVTFHRYAAEATDLCLIEGLPVTSPAATVIDCITVLGRAPAIAMTTDAMRRRLITPAVLVERAHRVLGRRGAGRVAAVARICGRGPWSYLEAVTHDLLQRHGITGWLANAEVHDASGLIGIVDLLFPAERLVVEIDGRRYHDGSAFQADRSRQNRLVRAGYRVLRFTADDVLRHPGSVVATICRVLAAAA